MSQSLISHSQDLKRLRDEGYEVEVRANHLLVHSVPYLDAQGNLAYGTLGSELTLASPLQTAQSYITEGNVAELAQFDFVFVCVDSGSARRTILEFLGSTNVPFIDVGMDVQVTDDSRRLWGMCRVTTSAPGIRHHVSKRVSMVDRGEDGLYAANIQVAELNAFNAVLAVIRWKRLLGYYLDDSGDHDCTFATSLNKIVNGEVKL